MARQKKTTTDKKTETKKVLIQKATPEEIKEVVERYKINLHSLATYNKCYIKKWIIIANQWINVLFKDEEWRVYSATNWDKVDASLIFIWAVQTYTHPEPITFIN